MNVRMQMSALAIAVLISFPAAAVAGDASWWQQVYLRDAAQLMGGFGQDTVGPGPRFGARAFGLEVRATPGAYYDSSIGSSAAGNLYLQSADWSGWFVGVSPLSFSTGTWGQASSLELVFLEPFVGYEFGSLKKASNGNVANVNLSGLQFGSRLYLKIPFGRYLAICLGGEAGYATIDWKHILTPGEPGTGFGSPSSLILAAFAGLTLTLGAP